MLNGIGGRTVAEAKLSMTYDEFLDWDSYMRKRGTLNTGMRLEWLFARLGLQINHAAGGKAKFEEFARYHSEPESDIDQIARLLGVKEVKKHA